MNLSSISLLIETVDKHPVASLFIAVVILLVSICPDASKKIKINSAKKNFKS